MMQILCTPPVLRRVPGAAQIGQKKTGVWPLRRFAGLEEKMKKAISIILVMALCLSPAAAAFAESEANEIDYTT